MKEKEETSCKIPSSIYISSNSMYLKKSLLDACIPFSKYLSKFQLLKNTVQKTS